MTTGKMPIQNTRMSRINSQATLKIKFVQINLKDQNYAWKTLIP
jgi:hypothetical protein